MSGEIATIDFRFLRKDKNIHIKTYSMKEEIDRVFKGYRPKTNKCIYWSLYYFLILIYLIRLKIFG